jgi:dethiobiotin synthetase
MTASDQKGLRGIFVTGTDTGVGKTLVAAGLLRVLAGHGLRTVGLKPVASGGTVTPQGLRNPDAEALAAESTVALPYDLTNPHCFEPAIAPHLAAADTGVCVSVDDLAAWYARATSGVEVAVVEGAGGWRVPLHPDGFLSDFAERLGLDVVLVVGLRLGCLNHARLTAEAIERSGRCRLAGWVGNHVDPGYARVDDNVTSLERLLGSPPLAIIPTLDPPSAEAASRHLANARTRSALGVGP